MYTAFLSYSQKADSRLARKVRIALHRIAIPWYKKRSLNIFLDKTSLSANPGLWPTIQRALDGSQYFILFASNAAAGSQWVRKELRYWLGEDPKKKSHRLFIVLTDGRLVWNDHQKDFDWAQTDALPPLPAGLFDEEPLYVDLRWAGEEDYPPEDKLAFKDAMATLAAPLHGAEKEDIFDREIRQQKIVIRLVSCAAFVFFVLMVVAGILAHATYRKAEENRSLALAAGARLAIGEDNIDQAITLGLQGLKTAYPVKEAEAVLTAAAFYRPGARRCFNAQIGPITSVDAHPDGEMAVSGYKNGTMLLWRLHGDSDPVRFMGHTGSITSVRFSPDGKQLLSASLDGSLRLWDVADPTAHSVFQSPSGGITAAVFNHDGGAVIYGSMDGVVRLWDTVTAKVTRQHKDHQATVGCVAVSPDGAQIASGDSKNTLCMWDLRTGHTRCIEKLGTWGITDLDFFPNGDSLLVGFQGLPGGINMVKIDTKSFSQVGQYRGNSGGTRLAFHPGGHGFLSGTYDNTVRFWDAKEQLEIYRYLGHLDDVTDIAFGPGGRYFLTGSKDGILRWWYFASPAETGFYADGRTGPLALSPDGKTILSGHDKLYLWSPESESDEAGAPFKPPYGFTQCVAFTPDGRQAVSGTLDGNVLLWDVLTGRLERVFQKIHLNIITSIATATLPNKRTVVLSGGYPKIDAIASSRDKLLVLWNLETGRVIRPLVGHDHTVTSVAVNTAGTLAVSGSYDKQVIVWDILSGKPLHRFKGHAGKVTGVVFGPDDRYVLSSSDDMSVWMWDLSSGKKVRRFTGHTYRVTCLDFSHSHPTLFITGSGDHTIRLWDLNSGDELARYFGHTKPLRRVLFGPGPANRIISLSWDDTLRFWALDPPVDIERWTYANRYVRQLTAAEKRRYGIDD